MTSNIKSYLVGTAIVSTVPGVAALLTGSDFSWVLSILFFGSLVLSGSIVATMASSWKILLACALSIPCTLVLVLLNTIHYLLGYPTDTPGGYGAMVVATVFLPATALVCGFGGVVGWLVTRSEHNKPLNARPRVRHAAH